MAEGGTERFKMKAVGGSSSGQGADLTVRSMPESKAAEAAVLGSMLLDPQCIGRIIEMMDREGFYRPEHQHIFDAIVSLYDKNRGEGVDGLLLRDELARRGQLELVGGVEYLQQILDNVPSSASVDYYAEIVRDKMLMRSVIDVASEVLNLAYEETGDPNEKLDLAEQKIFAVTDKKISNNAEALQNLVTQAYELIERRKGVHVTGLATGYHELDDMTCGLQNGEMIIVAGRPSMGKTSLVLNIAEHIGVEQKAPVLIFSLEMGKQQLAERFLCSVSGVDAQQVRKGMLNTDDYRQLVDACGILSDVPIFIDDSAALSPLEMRAKARRLKSSCDIRCVMVDYLQLMHLGAGRVESRQQEITTISRYLKGLARELNVPVVVLSQLNRAAEGREGHRPRMSDLRESGSIEQDADVVMLLHREDYYHRGDPDYEQNNTAELIIAKQRNGPTGIVPLIFREKLTRFENASHVDQEVAPF